MPIGIPLGHIDEALKQWATPLQAKYIDAVNASGSARQAAIALGVTQSLIPRAIAALKRKAAKHGYSPEHDMERTVPEGFSVRGVSTYYDSEGQVRGQWVKSKADDEAREQAIRDAYAAMAEELPRLPPIDPPAASESPLCNLFTFTDCHVGMLAWHKEGGADWDLKIAEATLTKAFEHMVRAAPRARVAVINQLGDFLHQDSLSAVTPTHHHQLDSDSRFSKIIGVALRILRRIIDRALETHEAVHVIMAEGNHDVVSSLWLRHMFKALYENEPRVTVNDSELPYYVYRHGATMLAFHHGHIRKPAELPLIFAAQYPEIWGATKHRYGHTGHRHHKDDKEHAGMEIFQHPTLAARDAYAARGGWIAARKARAITYHETEGEVSVNSVTIGML